MERPKFLVNRYGTHAGEGVGTVGRSTNVCSIPRNIRGHRSTDAATLGEPAKQKRINRPLASPGMLTAVFRLPNF